MADKSTVLDLDPAPRSHTLRVADPRSVQGLAVMAMFLLITLLCSGCGTIVRHYGSRGSCMSMRGEGVYQGTVTDCSVIAAPFTADRSWWLLPLGLIDLPFSLAADTLILPYDLIDTAALNKERQADPLTSRREE